MIKTFFFFCCFFACNLVIVAQSPTPQVIMDCKKLTSCNVNNDKTFPGGLTGAWAYVEYIKCSTNTVFN